MYYYELCNKMQVNVMGVFMKSRFTLLCLMPCRWTMISTAAQSGASLALPAYDALNYRARSISVKQQHFARLYWPRLY